MPSGKPAKENGMHATTAEPARNFWGSKDFSWSKQVAFCGPVDLPHHFVLLRWICKTLEYSGHGAPWFLITIIQMTVSIRRDAVHFWTNMVWALIMDLLVVGITKAIARRARPSYALQKNHPKFSPDRYSFPSGHSSRAVMVAILFCCLWVTKAFYQLAFATWAASVCVSRAILGRHYIGDVLAGAFLGLGLAWAHLTFLKLDLKTCLWILWPLHEYLFI